MELKQLQYIMCLPSPALPRLQEPESSKPTIGICKFCGQAYNVSFTPCDTQDEANEKAALTCDCPLAIKYQKTSKAGRKIEHLFGPDAGRYHKEAFSESIVDMLKDMVDKVCYGTMDKVTIDLTPGTKCKIARNLKTEEVSVVRIDTNKSQEIIE